MFKKLLTPIFVLLFLPAFFISVKAVSPPVEGVNHPPHVLEAQKTIAESYGLSGLANRLRANALEMDRTQAAGGIASPQALSVAVPVIIGSYSDNAHLFSSAQYQTLLFGANPTGSMTSYYSEVSYGNLSVTGTVYGSYTAAQTQAYYVNGDNGFGSDYPTNAGGFIVSVLGTADASINFAAFDNDGPDGLPNSGDDDGVVDGLVFIAPDGDASAGDDNVDTDGDSVPDACDLCPGFNDGLDADSDGIPNGCDVCPGFDDTQDADGDGIPDGCDGCCVGVVGDANMSNEAIGEVTVGDIAAIVDFLFGTGAALPCFEEADANQSGGTTPTGGDISVGDIATIVDNLFGTGTPLLNCP